MISTKNTIRVIAPEAQHEFIVRPSAFERAAAIIVDRLAELLCTQICALDDHGVVIASNPAQAIGRRFDMHDLSQRQGLLRIPLCLYDRVGSVIIGAPALGEALSPRLARALVQLFAGQALAAERSPTQIEQKTSFIRDLLEGALTDEETILHQANLLGLDLTTPRAVILIEAKEYILASDRSASASPEDARTQRRVHMIIGSVVGFFHLPNDTICTYIGNGEIVILKASNTKNLLPWADPKAAFDRAHSTWANLTALKRAGEALAQHLISEVSTAIGIGIGRYHPGVCGMARSYQDARAALELGKRCGGTNNVYCLDSLGSAAFVGISDERIKIELASHLLSPLDHEPELLDTLQVFFEQNCCAATTASRLVIHRNTLTYRLQKVALLTGLDPRRFDNAMQIHLALLLRSLGAPVS